MSNKVTIAMVYKSGGDVYDHAYVDRLSISISKYITIPKEVVLLTDVHSSFDNVDRIVQFSHSFPKWWGKIELFRNDIFDTNMVLYLDLDTIILKNINNIAEYNSYFCGLLDFYKLSGFGSGMMLFNPHTHHNIYTTFIEHSQAYMTNCMYGDQQFIQEQVSCIEHFQILFPNEIVSYKVHCMNNNHIPEYAKIICFHGNPRPHTLLNTFLQDIK